MFKRGPIFIRRADMRALTLAVRERSSLGYQTLAGPTRLADGTFLQAMIPNELIFGE